MQGKSFLVIGGAGTIGSNYIRAILPYGPKHITVIDYSENGLTELVRDLRSSNDLPVPDEFITYAFDFGLPLLEKVMQQTHFDVIACFAAHKHVRSEKDAIAVEAMFQNNVFNTAKLLKLANAHQPEHVFAVSTDKASGPVNVMGGTKTNGKPHPRLFSVFEYDYCPVCKRSIFEWELAGWIYQQTGASTTDNGA